MNICLLVLLLPSSSLSIRVLSTELDLARRSPATGAELLDSAVAGQDTLTVCARVIAYTFTHHQYLWSKQILLQIGDTVLIEGFAMTEEKPNGKTDAGDLWRNGDILLGIPDSFSRYREVSWIPGTWNSFCLSLSASKKQYDIMFNGVTLVTEGPYNGFHLKETGNVWMMGGEVTTGEVVWNSLFGAMTDVNIWNRSFSHTELVQWSRCELQTKGNILNWDVAHWNMVGLKKLEMKKDEVCGTMDTKPKDFLMIFKDEKTFDDTIRHCKAVGGEIAVASNTRALQEMIEAAKDTDECGSVFFSGYTDEQEEGVWREQTRARK